MFFNFFVILLANITVTLVIAVFTVCLLIFENFNIVGGSLRFLGFDIISKNNSDTLLQLSFLISLGAVIKIYVDQAMLDIPECRPENIRRKLESTFGVLLSKSGAGISLITYVSEIFTFVILPNTSYSLVFLYISVVSRLITMLSFTVAV